MAVPPTKDTTMLNNWQKTALSTYQRGNFGYLADFTSQGPFTAALGQCGDSLLRFIVSELSDGEDCASADEADRRIERAIDDMRAVLDALRAAPARVREE